MKLDATRIKVTVAPTIEPLTTAEVKLHLRVDHSEEDALIDRLIETARQQCEDISRRAFITRTLTANLDCWPAYKFELPYPPLLSVTSIKYTDIGGTQNTFLASNYIVDTHSEPGRVGLKWLVFWPTAILQEINAIEIVYTAGYGPAATDVPGRYKAAILLLVAHLYENREAAVVGQGFSSQALPFGLDALLLTDRGGW